MRFGTEQTLFSFLFITTILILREMKVLLMEKY